MNAPPTAHYPAWAKDFARRYFTRTLTQFILHGNVRDLVPTRDDRDSDKYVPLHDFLKNDFFAGRDIVIFYDRSTGLQFADKASRRDFDQALSGYDALYGTSHARKLPKDPVPVFTLLESFFRLRLNEGKRIACIIDFAETIVPMAEASMYSPEDRAALVFLRKWAHDPTFAEHDFTTCLVTENLSDLNQKLVQSPFTAEITLPYPDEEARKRFIDWYTEGRKDAYGAHADVSPEALADQSAGLNYVQLRTILADVLENQRFLTHEELSRRKKGMIEEAAFGMIEFIETDYTLDMVAGHTGAKRHLREAARALREGRRDVLPMGYLVSGPVGTGKTFMITCFAGEIGIPMVKLKNFRSQWQGVTEGNLEKILTLLEAMTPIAVLIDEADAALGNRGATGDSGVSSRVFAQIAAFMSVPNHRGRILFFLVTARPDLVPIDLKRQGRAEEHLALFYPATDEARRELLEVVMRRTDVQLDARELLATVFADNRSLSGADMEALFTRAKFRAGASNHGNVTPELLKETVEDFIPPTYPLEVELQTLAAVVECTSSALLPDKFRGVDRDGLLTRLQELKRLSSESR